MGTIDQSLAAIAKHGYMVLFAWVTAEQLGAPIPAVPILLAAGVLSATGQLSLAGAWALGVLGCLIGDTVWYGIGLKWGSAVLRVLCKISLEPDTCVRRGSNFVSRHGSRTLLIAKFLPGISTVSVPLTATFGASPPSFFFYDLFGSIFYIGVYLLVGWIIGDRIERLSILTDSIKNASIALAVVGALAILAWRYAERRRFRRDLRTARITPHELRDLIEGGESPFIVDLRHPMELLPEPWLIPGAVHMAPDELSARRDEIPRDREIILYCT